MTSYPEEVLTWMREREKKQRPFFGNSPQANARGDLMELICEVTEKLKLSVATTHLAVYLLDRFMDAYLLEENHLQLLALTTVMLAAKFEDKDLDVPGIAVLNAFADNQYNAVLFKYMEINILKFFNWNIGTATVAHFAEIYLMSGVCVGDTMEGTPITSPNVAAQTLWRATLYFLDLSIFDTVFLKWPNSQIAAACLACGRLSCQFVPTWPDALQKTTRYSIQSLARLMHLLLGMYKSEQTSSTCSTPESGYGSRCSSLQSSP